MRNPPAARIAPLLLLLSAAATAKPPPPPPKPSAAPAGLFRPLVQPNAKWTLHGPGGARILVETYDVRRVGPADVARLRYTVTAPGRGPSPLDLGAPRQVAVTAAGASFLPISDDDARIAAAIAKPRFTDPPQIVRRGSRGAGTDYVNLIHLPRGDKVCIGRASPPGAPCAGVCFAEICLNPEDGIVELGGTWTPNQESFTQTGWDR